MLLPDGSGCLKALKAPGILHELVVLYFRQIHNIAHTLFYGPSFICQIVEGRASIRQFYGMCSLAARNNLICPYSMSITLSE
jgi:hypothetical protein